ncbi:MAG: flagellar basal body L-ring protein FlgH [Pirellulales bacterium]
MKTRSSATARRVGLGFLLLAGALASDAVAQTSSLYNTRTRRAPLSLAGSSWIYQEMEKPKEIKLNDLVTVIINEKSQVISKGKMDRKKKASVDAVLKDWIMLDGWSIDAAPQTGGDQEINATLDNKLKSEANLETRDSMQLRVAGKVVDIRPNGNLVLEAHRTIRNNQEVWEASLSGIVRREDVLPNNTVMSENVAELSIYKRERGHVRDGYERGWLLRFLDEWQPF